MGNWAKKLSSQILWLKKVGKSGKLPIPNVQTSRYKNVPVSAAYAQGKLWVHVTGRLKQQRVPVPQVLPPPTELQAPLKHLHKEQTPEMLPSDDDNIPGGSPEGPHPPPSPSATPNPAPCDKEGGQCVPTTSIDSLIGAVEKVSQPRDLVWAVYVHPLPSDLKTFVHKGRVVAVHDTEVTVKWATDKNHTRVTASEVYENEEAAWAAFHKA